MDQLSSSLLHYTLYFWDVMLSQDPDLKNIFEFWGKMERILG